MMKYAIVRDNNYLAHYGISGQKKGLRRYQNEDGSLTPEGREHYGVGADLQEAKSMYKQGTINKQQYKEKKAEGKEYIKKNGNFFQRHKVEATVGILLAGMAVNHAYNTKKGLERVRYLLQDPMIR